MGKKEAIDFLYLSEEDMMRAGVDDMGACIEVMEEMFCLLSEGDYMMAGSNHNSHGAMVTFPEEPRFENMPKDGADRRFMAMPAYLGGKFDVSGVKWYGSNADNRKKGLPRSILTLMLNDKDTGAPLCLMSANLESAYRTGAVPGVGARYLAPENAKVLTIVGPGVMNKTSLASFVYTRPTLDTIKILGRGKVSIDSFIDYVQESFPQFKTIEVSQTLEQACRDADIISIGTSCTAENYPFIKGEWIKKGALISAPAGFLMEKEFLAGNVCKVVDNYGLYEAWAEEYPYPTSEKVPIIGCYFTDLMIENVISREDIYDIGDIITGKASLNRSPDDIVIFSIGGMPVEDLAWGMTCYRKALDLQIGQPIQLWEKPHLA